MVSWRAATAVAVAVAASASVDAQSTTATVTQYVLQSADTGSCRLKGIDSNSDNFKYYASVSAKDTTVNDGCARCIKVTKDGIATSLTAYVLDVCQGCKAGELKLSTTALSQLAIDPNSNNATVSYRFANCPASFLTGNVKACLMEGASNSYIPLQFYNSQKPIVTANISGLAATQNKDSFFFFASPNTGNADSTQWFKNVQVTLASADGESQTGSFEFGGTTGCATSAFQFSVTSTGAGDDGSGAAGTTSSSGGSSVVLPAVLGAVGALILIIGSIFFLRRRRSAPKEVETPQDGLDNQYLSPTGKSHPRSPERPTYAADNSLSLHNSTDDQSDGEPNSPTVAFDDAVTPVAATAAARNPYGEAKAQRQITPPPQQQQQYEYQSAPVQQTQQQTRQQEVAAGAPRVTYTTYVAPQSFAFSKPVDTERNANNNSFRGSQRAAPTFPAPVMPSRVQEEEAGGRSSFDIDDMRETEEIKERERFSSMADEVQAAPYHSDSPYASGHVTSPQSYVRATSLRRNSTKVPSDRPTLRFTSTQAQPSSQRQFAESFGDDLSDRDSYASGAYGRGTSGSDAMASNTGSFRESAPGYSRESLGILGYPHAKKSRTRGSITGTNTTS